MQMFSACCKETEEHPHIFTSSSSQFSEIWNGHARLIKMGMHVSSGYFPNSLCAKSCWVAKLQWPSNTLFSPPLLTIFHHNIAKESSGFVMVCGSHDIQWLFSRTKVTFEGKNVSHWNVIQTFQASREQVKRFILRKYKPKQWRSQCFLKTISCCMPVLFSETPTQRIMISNNACAYFYNNTYILKLAFINASSVPQYSPLISYKLSIQNCISPPPDLTGTKRLHFGNWF